MLNTYCIEWANFRHEHGTALVLAKTANDAIVIFAVNNEGHFPPRKIYSIVAVADEGKPDAQ